MAYQEGRAAQSAEKTAESAGTARTHDCKRTLEYINAVSDRETLESLLKNL